MGRHGRRWISVVAAATNLASGCGSDGEWRRCGPTDTRTPGVVSRTSSGIVECFCPTRTACNYGSSGADLDAATPDTGAAADASDRASFAEAGPMADGATDVLLAEDAFGRP